MLEIKKKTEKIEKMKKDDRNAKRRREKKARRLLHSDLQKTAAMILITPPNVIGSGDSFYA